MNTETVIRDAVRDLDVSPRPEFLQDLRERLHAEAELAELSERPARHRSRGRKILLAVVAAVLVVVGTFALVQARSDDNVSVTTGPEGDARALAQQMLDTLALPPGARMQTPSPMSAGPGPLGPSTQVVLSARWFVSAPTNTVAPFIEKHRPGQLLGSGRGTGPGNTRSVYWMLKSLPPGIAQADMNVTVRDAPGGSVVDATARVTWYPVRPASEAIPARDKVAIIDQYPKNQHKVVTEPAEVAKLVAAFNASHLLLDAPHSCPLIPPGSERDDRLYMLRFAPAPGAPADVVVNVPAHGCRDAEVTVNGQPQPKLSPDRLDQAVGAALPS
jgi:hypothetical protein